MNFTFAVVDWEAMLEVVWVSFVAGIGVTAAFAAGLLGATRWVDYGRSGRGGEAVIYGALALIGFGIVAAAVVFGIVAMTDK